MEIKAVLFDKDGTLIDFADTFFEACAAIIHKLSENNLQVANDLARLAEFDLEAKSCPANSQIVGGTSLTIAELWQPILMRKSAAHLSRELDNHFDEYTQNSVTAFDYTSTTLSKLKEMNIDLGVATNDSEENARSHLTPIGIVDMFSFIAGYDSGFGSKPEPGMVQAFTRQSGVEPHQVAMVGDSKNDLLAARSAGAIAIAVTSGIADRDGLSSYADHVFDNISELPEFIFNAKGV